MLLSVPGKVLNRILLERLKEAVDPLLRDQQAGIHDNWSYDDHKMSAHDVEQFIECNSPIYINYIYYEKAFDIIRGQRENEEIATTLWSSREKIGSIILCTYKEMSCKIQHAVSCLKVSL